MIINVISYSSEDHCDDHHNLSIKLNSTPELLESLRVAFTQWNEYIDSDESEN